MTSKSNRSSRAERGSKPLYRPSGIALVRMPLLPVEIYNALANDAHGAARDRQSRDTVPPKELEDGRVRMALAVSSAELMKAFEKWRNGSAPSKGLPGKILRYLIRMSTRPTPYGLFAGVSAVEWEGKTDLRMKHIASAITAGVDMGWFLRFVLQLENDPDILKMKGSRLASSSRRSSR